MRKSPLEYSARWRVLYPWLVDQSNSLNPPDAMTLAMYVQWLAAGALGTWAVRDLSGRIRECPQATARQVIWARWVVRRALEQQAAQTVEWKLYQPARDRQGS